jgi:hypothetical protein
MNTLQHFGIYSEAKCDNQINNKFRMEFNKNFDVTVQHDNDKGIPDHIRDI